MKTYFGATLLSPSVDIFQYLPSLPWLKELNFFELNRDAVRADEHTRLEVYLLDSRDYRYYAIPQNLYLPLPLYSPIFRTQVQTGPTVSYTSIPFNSSILSRTNNFISNTADLRNLKLEALTAKLWAINYQTAIDYYTREIERIEKLEAHFKKEYRIIIYNNFATPNEQEYGLIELYNIYKESFERDIVRIQAIQYECEQRVLFFIANSTLPAGLLTPEFEAYYSEFNYNIRRYPYNVGIDLEVSDTPRNNLIYRLDSSCPKSKPAHSPLLPRKVTGTLFWGLEEQDYTEDQHLILLLDRMVDSDIFSRLGISAFRFYHAYDFYQIPFFGRAKQHLTSSIFRNNDDTHTGYREFHFESFGDSLGVGPYSKIDKYLTISLDAVMSLKSNTLLGIPPEQQKTKDSISTRQPFNSIFPYFNSRGKIEDYNGIGIAEYDTLRHWFFGQFPISTTSVKEHYTGNGINTAITKTKGGVGSKHEFMGFYADEPIREEVPGWEEPIFKTENTFKTYNEDNDTWYYKRSANVEFFTTNVTTGTTGPASPAHTNTPIIRFRPEYVYFSGTVWFGGSLAKPPSPGFPDVIYGPSDDLDDFQVLTPFVSLTEDSRFPFVRSNPLWLNPIKTTATGTFRVDKVFTSTQLREKYVYEFTHNEWVYDGFTWTLTPTTTDVILYEIVYNLSTQL